MGITVPSRNEVKRVEDREAQPQHRDRASPHPEPPPTLVLLSMVWAQGCARQPGPRLQLVATPPARGHTQLAPVCMVPRPVLCLSLALYARCVIHARLLPPLGLGEALGSPKLAFYFCVFRTHPTEPLLPPPAFSVVF